MEALEGIRVVELAVAVQGPAAGGFLADMGADMFLSNYREPALERIGMGYERLAERNLGLVYGTANGFGPLGPARQNRMSDQYAQARS